MAEGDPSSTLYNYKFQISTTRLMVETQINWMLNSPSPFLNKVFPFINIGIGPTWNKMNQYHEMAFNDMSYPPLFPFQSRTQSNFAYQIGCGLGKVFSFKKAQSDEASDKISVGYRYANLGHTTFGTRGLLYPYPLNIGSLQNNEVYLSYTHLF